MVIVPLIPPADEEKKQDIVKRGSKAWYLSAASGRRSLFFMQKHKLDNAEGC